MARDRGILEKLAARIAAGDSTAEPSFRAHFEEAMAREARCVLSNRTAASPLALRIRRMAQQLTSRWGQSSTGRHEKLIAQVTQALCEKALQKLRQQRPGALALAETLRY